MAEARVHARVREVRYLLRETRSDDLRETLRLVLRDLLAKLAPRR